MAKFFEPHEIQLIGWDKWVKSRPPEVRAIAERFLPWELYRLKTTGQRVTLRSILDNGTISVIASNKYNQTLFDLQVFGIDPDDLEPCDLPTPNEIKGY